MCSAEDSAGPAAGVVSADRCLHPELLTWHQLLAVIRERHLKIPALEQLSRESLLEIFHQYCVPYGQRRYRDTVRGKILNKNRGTLDSSPTKFHASPVKMDTTEYRELARHSQNLSDRLRAPPDLTSRQIKKIKISNGVQTPNISVEFSINKRKADNSNKDINNSEPLNKKARKPITWP